MIYSNKFKEKQFSCKQKLVFFFAFQFLNLISSVFASSNLLADSELGELGN